MFFVADTVFPSKLYSDLNSEMQNQLALEGQFAQN